MGKNIILLSDGTGNSAAKLHKTNVWRVYQALDLTTDAQIAQYDDGVGVSRFRPLALLGSGLGFGLARNVRHLYAFLSRNYKKKDYDSTDKPKIFAFGFSRGAYTIRLLIGLVVNQGLVDSELPEEEFQRQVRKRWAAFRRERFPWFGAPSDKKQGQIVPQFEFVGLWDTVGAYGLPFEELQRLLPLARLPNRNLSSIVICAYHALSLDDDRRSFHPILWNEGGTYDSKRIQQVWFPGVHSNIGGGYPKDKLSYVSLNWMVAQAKSLGLKFHDDHIKEFREQASAHGELYDPRAGLGCYYRYSPRPVTRLCNDTMHGVTIKRPKVHESTFERIMGGRVAYGPIGVPLVYDLVLEKGDIIPGPCEAVEGANGETKIVATGSHGEPKSQYLEDGDRAIRRATRMEAVWNLAWWRRIVYALTVIFSLFLVASPLVAKLLGTKELLPELTSWLARYLGPILMAIGYVVPDWVETTWLRTFREEPVLFLIGAITVIVTMLIGSSLGKKIHSRASDIWHYKPTSKIPKWAEDPKSTILYKLRSQYFPKSPYR